MRSVMPFGDLLIYGLCPHREVITYANNTFLQWFKACHLIYFELEYPKKLKFAYLLLFYNDTFTGNNLLHKSIFTESLIIAHYRSKKCLS